MKKVYILIILLFIFFIPLSTSSNLMLGDYSAEPRINGRVNNVLLIDSLKEASINTYAYLIWHNKEYDWEDFNSFLPLAQENNINTYVYLAPPTEDCEEVLPYGCDFVSWGEEIARLSLQYPTLKGFIIDDFIAARNDLYFTREYTNNFIASSKEINSNLQFLPIIYYLNADIMDYIRDYKDLTDGIIFPYIGLDPERNLLNTNDEMDQIRKIDEILRYNNKIILFAYPWNQPSNEGDYIVLSKTIQVPENIEELDEILISFTISDDCNYLKPEGYHYIQLLIDDEIVWEEDVINKENIKDINLDIKNYLIGKREATISFRAIEKKRVGNFGVKISIINLKGIIDSYDFVKDSNSEWTAEILDPLEYNEDHKVVVMVYAAKLNTLDDIPSAEYVTDAIQIAIESFEEGLSSGVMLYALRKNNNPIYRSVRELYGSYNGENIVNPPPPIVPPEIPPENHNGGNNEKSFDIDTSSKNKESLTYPSCRSDNDCNEGEICKAKRGNYFYKQCQSPEDKNIEQNSGEIDSWALKLKNKIIEWFFKFLSNFNFQKT